MMEQVLASENLRKAWRRVKANAGAPGIDGMTGRGLSGVLPGTLAKDTLCAHGGNVPSGAGAPGVHSQT